MKQFLIFAVIILGFIYIIGCGGNDTTFSSNGDTIDTYGTEQGVSVSLDRDYIILSSEHPVNPGENGLYYAKSGNPVREKLLSGAGYLSPALASVSTRAAFVENSKIKYYDISSRMISTSALPAVYSSVAFLNDTMLVAQRGDSLDVIYRRTDSVLFSIRGYDPTMYRSDTVLFLRFLAPNINECSYLTVQTQNKITEAWDPTTASLDTILTTSKVRWFSMEPTLKRFAYAVEVDTAYEVYTSQVGASGNSAYYISTIDRPSPNMLNFSQVIFPGEDGRLYKADYDGQNQFPYWGEVGSNE